MAGIQIQKKMNQLDEDEFDQEFTVETPRPLVPLTGQSTGGGVVKRIEQLLLDRRLYLRTSTARSSCGQALQQRVRAKPMRP